MTDSRRILLGAIGEEEFARHLKRRLHRTGWHGIHVRYSQGVVEGVHTTRLHGHSDAHGMVDWICAHEEPGHPALALELKAETGRVDQRHQAPWHRWLGHSNGLICEVLRPSDEDLLEKLLRA